MSRFIDSDFWKLLLKLLVPPKMGGLEPSAEKIGTVDDKSCRSLYTGQEGQHAVFLSIHYFSEDTAILYGYLHEPPSNADGWLRLTP